MLFPPWPLVLKALFLAGIAGSGALAWRCRQPLVDCLRLLDDGRLECRFSGGESFLEAELLPRATVHPWLTAVPLKVGGRKITVVVTPDSLDADDFRRLRLWLRWRADFSAAKSAV